MTVVVAAEQLILCRPIVDIQTQAKRLRRGVLQRVPVELVFSLASMPALGKHGTKSPQNDCRTDKVLLIYLETVLKIRAGYDIAF